MISVGKNVHRRRFTTGSVPNVFNLPCTEHESVQTNKTKLENKRQRDLSKQHCDIDLECFFSYWGTVSKFVNIFAQQFFVGEK